MVGDTRHLDSPADLKARLEAERAGDPFMHFRDLDGAQHIVVLGPEATQLWIGRSTGADIALAWDTDASRVHAELQRVGEEWTIADDGLSHNGTFVNDVRIHGRRRLASGDRLRCGQTVIAYVAPGESDRDTTATAHSLKPPTISAAQRRVLIELVRPLVEGHTVALPASNAQIAAKLYLSVAAVKTHLRALSESFGVERLPQNQKRARLAELALESGAISPEDLVEPAQ